MLEIITSLYTFWSYIDDANTLRKIFAVIKKYISFLSWYWINPEVKLKYCKLVSKQKEKNTIEKVYDTLVEHNKEFGDDFFKSVDKLNFELLNSKLNYRVSIDNLSGNKQNLQIETKYFPFYPLRKFRKLNELTSEFNAICELICNPLKISNSNNIIFVQIDVETKNNSIVKFEKLNAEITFKNNKIQINNFHGSEHGEFIFFFIVKWLIEYRRN